MASQVSKTLLYSDIFDYPLTFSQIHKYLITSEKVDIEELRSLLKKEKIKQKDGFYFLDSRDEIVELRKQREIESNKKIKYAKKISESLKFIPGILFLGISGSLSVKNADSSDDIDLFIISYPNQIWITRLLTVLFLKLKGVYREKNMKDTSNKFCANMFVDFAGLKLPKSRQDIYSAHEVVQLLPIFDKDNTYKKFLDANIWTQKYLANFYPEKIKSQSLSLSSKFILRLIGVAGLETAAKYIQLKYMGKRKGGEMVAKNILAFHPDDPRKYIVKAYKTRLK